MRCLSPHEKYSIQVIEGEEQVGMDARGTFHSIQLRKPVIANFENTGLLDHEQEAALMAFDFSGLPNGVNPLTKVSVFDTETYVMQHYPEDQRDSMIVQIDERLRDLAKTLAVGEFIIVDQPEATKPWPKYDDYDPEDIFRFQEALGVDPQTIRLYELENQKRQEVIEKMLDLEDPARASQEGDGEQQEGEVTVQA